MKNIAFILVIISSFAQLRAQEFGIFTTYGGSSYNKYEVNTGIGLEYTQLSGQRSRWGVSAAYSHCTRDYNEIFGSTIDGVSTFIHQVSPNNQQLAFKLNYAFRVLNHPKSGLFLGPEIGIHYFFVDEQVHRLANENLEEAKYQSNYTERNKFGFGFLFEFELNEFIYKQLSVHMGVHPELIRYQKSGMDGGHQPPVWIGGLNFQLGISYQFKKQGETASGPQK